MDKNTRWLFKFMPINQIMSTGFILLNTPNEIEIINPVCVSTFGLTGSITCTKENAN